MSVQGSAAVIPPLNRVERVAGRGLRDRERKSRGKRRATRADVAAHEALLSRLTLVHQVAFERIDWDTIVELGPVAPAVRRDAKAAAAKRELAHYRPSMLDTLLGLEADKRRKLTSRIVDAAKADAEAYGRALEAASAHNRILTLAPDVAALKPEAIAAALRAGKIVGALKGALEGVVMEVRPGRRVAAFIDLLEFDALPDEAATLSPAGVPIHAAIPPIERRQLQLANACAVVLRVGVEVLQATDIEAVEVVAQLCPPGGLAEEDMVPVLYLKLSAASLAKLDLRKLEAAPTVTALKPRIDWSAARGFAPIRIDDLGLGDPTRLAAPA